MATSLDAILTCPICYEPYSYQPSTITTPRQHSHLPVHSSVCSDKICCSCLTNMKAARIKSEKTKLPKYFKCPICGLGRAFRVEGEYMVDLFACQSIRRIRLLEEENERLRNGTAAATIQETKKRGTDNNNNEGNHADSGRKRTFDPTRDIIATSTSAAASAAHSSSPSAAKRPRTTMPVTPSPTRLSARMRRMPKRYDSVLYGTADGTPYVTSVGGEEHGQSLHGPRGYGSLSRSSSSSGSSRGGRGVNREIGATSGISRASPSSTSPTRRRSNVSSASTTRPTTVSSSHNAPGPSSTSSATRRRTAATASSTSTRPIATASRKNKTSNVSSRPTIRKCKFCRMQNSIERKRCGGCRAWFSATKKSANSTGVSGGIIRPMCAVRGCDNFSQGPVYKGMCISHYKFRSTAG